MVLMLASNRFPKFHQHFIKHANRLPNDGSITRKLSWGIAVVFITLSLFVRSVPVHAIDPLTAIVGGSMVLAKLTETLKSGANPTAVATFQNRQVVFDIQDRLDNYDSALIELLRMSRDFSRTLENELTKRERVAYKNNAAVSVKQIYDTLRLATSTGFAGGSARLQLHDLERTSLLLVEVSDPLLLPSYILLLQIQLAFYGGHHRTPYTEPHWKLAIEDTKIRYAALFSTFYSDRTSDSLHHSSLAVERDLTDAIAPYEQRLQKLIEAEVLEQDYNRDILALKWRVEEAPGRWDISGSDSTLYYVLPDCVLRHVADASKDNRHRNDLFRDDKAEIIAFSSRIPRLQALNRFGSIRELYALVIECLERQEVGLWTARVSRCGFRRRAG